MAIFKNTPPIVTSGLVLHLDAANRRSYVSGSTIWNDMSGNGYTGSLFSNPAFDPTNGGSIVFNGTTNYASLGVLSTLPTGTSNRTMMGWVQDNSSTDYVGDLSPLFGYGNNSNGQFFMLSVGGTTYNNRKFILWGNVINYVSTFSIDRDIWNHVAITVTTGVSFPRLTIYKNGVADAGLERNINTVNGSFDITDSTSDPAYAINFKGKISNIQTYNRALSAQEVKQNYDALKTRFNLS
jgi:hypothetical protein